MTDTKRKAGRPPVGPNPVELTIRIDRSERDSIDAAALAAGLSRSEWLRRAAGYCMALRVPLRHVVVGPLPDVPAE